MVFVSSKVADVFIFLGIILGGILILAAIIFVTWKFGCSKMTTVKVEETKQESERHDDSKHLSKISVNNWQSPEHIDRLEKPVVIQQDICGEFHMRNSNNLSNSGLERQPVRHGNNENKVLLIDVASDNDIQQARDGELSSY
jgi:hypothetical protein